ncbi:MAG: cytochrome c [Candidatus Kapabacteria bacterium]|nr:cytochrome c [Candidatus Kapabacteria bacterium]
MKRILKWAGLAVSLIALIVGGFALFIQLRSMPKFDVSVPDITVQSTPERIARGRHLAMSLCAECHRHPTTRTLSGTQMLDLPEQFGVAFSKNITNHPTKGIGSWKDGEIIWLLRTGIHPKTGLYVPPWMPKFVHMSDEDLQSIVAWLRSDDPIVAATDQDNTASTPSWFAKFLVTVAFKPFDYPKTAIAQPDTTNLVSYGKYLATGVYDCYACHSADIATMNQLEPEKSPGFMGGGTQMLDVNRNPMYATNITFDKTHGIGSWTEGQFIVALRDGFRPNGAPIRYPMPRGVHMSELELRAMYAYLQTVPVSAKANVPSYAYTPASGSTAGEKAYHAYGCVNCHGATGVGYGDLRLADKKYPDDTTLISVIRNVRTYYPESTMPVWDGHVKEDDYASLAAHVRRLGK